jgi:hypothetical protein
LIVTKEITQKQVSLFVELESPIAAARDKKIPVLRNMSNGPYRQVFAAKLDNKLSAINSWISQTKSTTLSTHVMSQRSKSRVRVESAKVKGIVGGIRGRRNEFVHLDVFSVKL